MVELQSTINNRTMNSKTCYPMSVEFLMAACLVVSTTTGAFSQLDDSWTVTVSGQTVHVNPDGSFLIPNVSAPDQFGLGGPGTSPDFVGDDFVRAVAVSTKDVGPIYAFSEPFQFRNRETFLIGEMTFTDTPPPFPNSIRITSSKPVLNELGQTTQLSVTGLLLSDDSTIDLTQRSSWTIYRTSNPQIAVVGENGLVTAIGAGTVFITAINEGATGVAQIRVIPGDPLTTLEGFVQFEDGAFVEGAEVSILGLDGMDTTDGTGFFSIPDLPSGLDVPLIVRANVVIGEVSFVGSKQTDKPIPAGVTDAGIITLETTGGGFGPVLLSGMDPEEHGVPGSEMIRDFFRFVVGESAIHAEPTKILMLGSSTFVANIAQNIAVSLGYSLTHVRGAEILSADFFDFDAIYMGSVEREVTGGINIPDLLLIAERGADIVHFVNSGGGLASFSQQGTGAYEWLKSSEPLAFTTDVSGGIAITPAGEFFLSESAVNVEPFHNGFTGPPGLFGLDILATEDSGKFTPLIIGGIADIPPDCNGNGIGDQIDLLNNTSQDCNENGRPDECESDCNANGLADECDINDGISTDIVGAGAIGDGVPDECQLDCNGNLIPDDLDIENGTSQDCNGNTIPDECDISGGTSLDCQPNGIPDECEIDCNGNSVPDDCDITSGTSLDCNANGSPDECDISGVISLDCQPNGIPDECDINNGTSTDIVGVGVVGDGVPDECQLDCNGNLIPDDLDIENGTSQDCNGNTIPDECDISGGTSLDCQPNGIPDECEMDCNGNGVPDDCDITSRTSLDCNTNGIPDECETDCNGNGVLDDCDLANGTSLDCNTNGIPDECETDCNGNGVLDDCDLANGTSLDCNTNGIPDECDLVDIMTYDITFENLLNVPGNCGGGSVHNGCTEQPGFSWTDIGSETVLAVQIEFNIGVECHILGTTHQTSLNDIPDMSYASTPEFCECLFTPGEKVTIIADVGSYNLGDLNSFLITSPSDCIGFIPRTEWGSGTYARITVTYDGDCNANGVPDDCDIANGTSVDVVGTEAAADGVPDECQFDCNENLIPDELDHDCNSNGVPDGCDIADGTSADVDENGIPDECDSAILDLINRSLSTSEDNHKKTKPRNHTQPDSRSATS